MQGIFTEYLIVTKIASNIIAVIFQTNVNGHVHKIQLPMLQAEKQRKVTFCYFIRFSFICNQRLRGGV